MDSAGVVGVVEGALEYEERVDVVRKHGKEVGRVPTSLLIQAVDQRE